MKQKCRINLAAMFAIATTYVASFHPTEALAATIKLPACGNDPNKNTKQFQEQFDRANPGDTLILPSGICVVARCDLANGQVQACLGTDGLRHRSALFLGAKSNLTLAGAADRSSVIKLDPHPPGTPGQHPYCGDTHVVSMHLSSFITLRDFTIDGSENELPNGPDDHPCPPNPRLESHSTKLDEHLHDLRIVNSTDVVVQNMKITHAFGDGVNLIAERTQTSKPFSERISITDTQFLDNKRSGITFQRNVGFVTVKKNFFLDSGLDQDIDMEPSGGPDDRGPYGVTIDSNTIERKHGGIAVTLGAGGGVQRAQRVAFSNNKIQEAQGLHTFAEGGGCIFVFGANKTTISDNQIIGGGNCTTLAAQEVNDLVIEHNQLESYQNSTKSGNFVQKPVIDIAERIVNQGDTRVCGEPPEKTESCPYFIYYPDRTTIRLNTLVQRVQNSLGLRLSNANDGVISDNNFEFTDEFPANGVLVRNPRATGIEVPFGLPSLPRPTNHGHYLNERLKFTASSITANTLTGFADGLHLARNNAAVTVGGLTIKDNRFDTRLVSPRGIVIQGSQPAPEASFINRLLVQNNRYGCGFVISTTGPTNAFVRPARQLFSGNIGVSSCR